MGNNATEAVSLSWETETGGRGWMIFDIVLALTHTGTVQVTEDPIEDGSSISDHAFNSPDTISLVGFVSNTPLPSNPAVGSNDDRLSRTAFMFPTNIVFRDLPKPPTRASVSGAVGLLAGAFSGNNQEAAGVAVSSSGYRDRVLDAFELLRSLKRNFVRIKVHTTLFSYDDMLIRSLVIPENFEDAKEFRVDFRELFTGTTATIDAVAPAPVELQAAPRHTAPKKGEEPDNEPENSDKARKSLLAKGVDFVRGAS